MNTSSHRFGFPPRRFGLAVIVMMAAVFPASPLLVVPVASPDYSEMLAAFRMSDGHRAWQVAIRGPVEAPLSAAPGGMLVYEGG